MSQKTKKPLTRKQKKLRYDIRRFSILGGLGLCAIGVLVLLVFLITLPFRLLSDKAPDETDTPSEISLSAPEASQAPEAQELTLMAVGDNLIHNTVFEFAQQPDGSYDFRDIYSYITEDLQAADIACIQQETIFISDPAEYTNYPEFGTPAEMAGSLSDAGFDVICHASNHTYDKLMAGIEDTIAAWKNYPQVTVLGIHESQEHADSVQVVEKNGIRLAMLNYTYGLNYGVPAMQYSVDLLWTEKRGIIQEQIQKAKEISDMVIVFMHCGTENSYTPNADQTQWAQFFADNGVGLVIGTHPHVIQPTDVIIGSKGNQMPIFYSLGNFVSSQRDTGNLLGGMANVTIRKDQYGTYVSEFSMTPVVTWIRGGGTVGTGYRFHTLHLEEYTDDMAAEHIRDACYPEDFQSIWNQVNEASVTFENMNSALNTDSTIP